MNAEQKEEFQEAMEFADRARLQAFLGRLVALVGMLIWLALF